MYTHTLQIPKTCNKYNNFDTHKTVNVTCIALLDINDYD